MNLLTEDEARQRICPFAFFSSSGVKSCHASSCMAWEFAPDGEARNAPTSPAPAPAKVRRRTAARRVGKTIPLSRRRFDFVLRLYKIV